ncbi:hypothetical protein PLESTB_001269500 [Pleodorina starrii]|uniref:Uncharacterized protein n=1 Tax=Pleodorina starrii TaxID=330485 RepID=A0A9W6BT87_9CHLO|nr:hypothetical protein PLESTB_001269500 [Pleodorina starrii]
MSGLSIAAPVRIKTEVEVAAAGAIPGPGPGRSPATRRRFRHLPPPTAAPPIPCNARRPPSSLPGRGNPRCRRRAHSHNAKGSSSSSTTAAAATTTDPWFRSGDGGDRQMPPPGQPLRPPPSSAAAAAPPIAISQDKLPPPRTGALAPFKVHLGLVRANCSVAMRVRSTLRGGTAAAAASQAALEPAPAVLQ